MACKLRRIYQSSCRVSFRSWHQVYCKTFTVTHALVFESPLTLLSYGMALMPYPCGRVRGSTYTHSTTLLRAAIRGVPTTRMRRRYAHMCAFVYHTTRRQGTSGIEIMRVLWDVNPGTIHYLSDGLETLHYCTREIFAIIVTPGSLPGNA